MFSPLYSKLFVIPLWYRSIGSFLDLLLGSSQLFMCFFWTQLTSVSWESDNKSFISKESLTKFANFILQIMQFCLHCMLGVEVPYPCSSCPRYHDFKFNKEHRYKNLAWWVATLFIYILSFLMHAFITTFKQHIHPFLLAEASLHFPHCSMLMCSVGKPLNECGADNWNRTCQHTIKGSTLQPCSFQSRLCIWKKGMKSPSYFFHSTPPIHPLLACVFFGSV